MFRSALIRRITNVSLLIRQKAFSFLTPLRGFRLKDLPIEAAVWTTGLIALASIDTSSTNFSLCPLALANIDICPGCGLGKSISLLLRGRLSDSIQAHPLGMFALITLSFRITSLTKQYIQHYGKNR